MDPSESRFRGLLSVLKRPPILQKSVVQALLPKAMRFTADFFNPMDCARLKVLSAV
jgi:hypothetical protein